MGREQREGRRGLLAKAGATKRKRDAGPDIIKPQI